MWCWGVNSSGQLGDGTTTDSPVPVQVSGHATDWATVTAGGDHTCAEKTGGTVWCWGDNGNGELGDGTTTRQPGPGPGQRARHRLGHRHRRPGLHVRGKGRRHRVVLGSQQLRPARGRHYH